MMSTMSWVQYVGWHEYYRQEPFGEYRADLRMGINTAILANINRDPSKKDGFSPEDFMPKFGDMAAEVAKKKAGDANKPLTSKQDWAAVKRRAIAYAKAGLLGDGPAPLKRVSATHRTPVPSP